MTDPFDLLQQAIPDFAPNREVAIFFDPAPDVTQGYRWQVEVINDCMHVRLGEVPGEVSTHADTLEEAIADAIAQLKALTVESFT